MMMMVGLLNMGWKSERQVASKGFDSYFFIHQEVKYRIDLYITQILDPP